MTRAQPVMLDRDAGTPDDGPFDRTAPQAAAPPILELVRVTHRFADVTALDDITISARQGEFLTILGESGSGKTTLLRIIAGLETPTRIERLTIAERALLANVRIMERYRRGFYLNVVTGRDAGQGPSRRGGVFGGDGDVAAAAQFRLALRCPVLLGDLPTHGLHRRNLGLGPVQHPRLAGHRRLDIGGELGRLLRLALGLALLEGGHHLGGELARDVFPFADQEEHVFDHRLVERRRQSARRPPQPGGVRRRRGGAGVQQAGMGLQVLRAARAPMGREIGGARAHGPARGADAARHQARVASELVVVGGQILGGAAAARPNVENQVRVRRDEVAEPVAPALRWE